MQTPFASDLKTKINKDRRMKQWQNNAMHRYTENNETDISLTLILDGNGKQDIATGIGFFDHMLSGFTRHGFFDLDLRWLVIWKSTVIIQSKIPGSSLEMPSGKLWETKKESNDLAA